MNAMFRCCAGLDKVPKKKEAWFCPKCERIIEEKQNKGWWSGSARPFC